MYYYHKPSIPLGGSTHDLSLTQVSGHKNSHFHQSWAVNTTSWLLDLAQLFEEEGDNEIAIAVYRKVAEAIVSRDHEKSEANRTSISYFCLYRISRCYMALNETQNAINHAYEAFQVLPRKEPYYHVARYFDYHEKDDAKALYYYGLAAKAPTPPAGVFIKEANIYELDIEKDII